MYTQDYDEVLPGNDTTEEGWNLPKGLLTPCCGTYANRNWARDVQPYIRNTKVLVCPTAMPRSGYQGGGGGFNETTDPAGANTSYLMNGIASTRPLAALYAPADIIYLREFIIYTRTAQIRPYQLAPGSNQYAVFNHPLYDGTHKGGSNLLFCDQHARWQKKTSIKFSQFGADPNSPDPACKGALDDAGAVSPVCNAAF